MNGWTGGNTHADRWIQMIIGRTFRQMDGYTMHSLHR